MDFDIQRTYPFVKTTILKGIFLHFYCYEYDAQKHDKRTGMTQTVTPYQTESSSQLTWTVGKSIGGLTLLLLVLQLAISVNFIFELEKMYHQIKKITETTIPLKRNIREIALKQYQQLHSLGNLSRSLQKQSQDRKNISELSKSADINYYSSLDFSQLSKVIDLTTRLNMPAEMEKSRTLVKNLTEESYDIEKQSRKLIHSLTADDFDSANQIISQTQKEIKKAFVPTQELTQLIEKITDQELRLIRKRGVSSIRISLFALIITLLLGVGLSMFISNQILSRLRWNIEQRENAENKLLDTAKELKRSNEDLEQFAYVTSHDLQTPLSVILGYLSLMNEKRDISLEDCRTYLPKIGMAAQRMSIFIKDLLEYSRASSEKRLSEEINLNILLNDILKDFEFKVKEYKAQIKIHPMPMLRADSLQLKRLFQNLISNALKFSKSSVQPVINISAEPSQPDWIQIRVQDNGIGFDPKDSESIFEPFKRLHSYDVYEGSGIGLALCKKIIANHGGRIFAKSKPGEGSSFYLIFPAGKTV